MRDQRGRSWGEVEVTVELRNVVNTDKHGAYNRRATLEVVFKNTKLFFKMYYLYFVFVCFLVCFVFFLSYSYYVYIVLLFTDVFTLIPTKPWNCIELIHVYNYRFMHSMFLFF